MAPPWNRVWFVLIYYDLQFNQKIICTNRNKKLVRYSFIVVVFNANLDKVNRSNKLI